MEKNVVKQNKLLMSLLIDSIILFVTLFVVFANDDSIEDTKVIGILLIITSINMLIKCRHNKFMLLLFAIICYINLTVSLEDFGLTESTIFFKAQYQLTLRYSQYNVVAAKCILLLNVIISTTLPYKILAQGKEQQIKMKDNSIIYYTGLCVLIYGLIFGIERGNRISYVSNSNVLYEYCIVIFVFLWYYSGNSQRKKNALIIYAIIYVLQGFIYGDRSSMFPMCVLIVLLCVSKIKLEQVVILCLIGVLTTNFIAEYRNNFEIPNLLDVFNRGIKSDTVTYSHYAALSILRTKDMVADTSSSMLDFVIGIFMGGNYGEANVTRIAKEYVGNSGGGFFYSFFYYWLGYLGVIISALIAGGTMRLLLKKNGELSSLILLIITAMSFRWYLYGPITFFRVSIVIPCVLWILCNLFDRLVRRKTHE